MPEPVAPKLGALWTTADVARAFDVGASSVRRWTDEGVLEATKTEGGHRRYRLSNLYRFAGIRKLPTDRLPPLDQNDLFDPVPPPRDLTLIDALISGNVSAVRQLVVPHVESPLQRATFLDRVVGDALRELGRRWKAGEIGIDQEHLATHILAEAVDRIRPTGARTGKIALLACPPDEWHEMPLRLLRLVFEWGGWRTELAGAALPWSAMRDAVTRLSPAIVALSARSRAAFESPEFAELADFCSSRQTIVISGGEWRARATSPLHFRTLRAFEKWLRTQ